MKGLYTARALSEHPYTKRATASEADIYCDGKDAAISALMRKLQETNPGEYVSLVSASCDMGETGEERRHYLKLKTAELIRQDREAA